MTYVYIPIPVLILNTHYYCYSEMASSYNCSQALVVYHVQRPNYLDYSVCYNNILNKSMRPIKN